jgi:hypothetical protein
LSIFNGLAEEDPHTHLKSSTWSVLTWNRIELTKNKLS